MNISFLSHSIFGTKHLIILAICITAIVLCSIYCKKLSLDQARKIVLGVGIVSETIKVFYYIIQNEATHGGYLPKTDLPFHLCSIQIILIMVASFASSQKVRKLIYGFMMPTCLCGGIAALLIATSSSLNGMLILSIQYFGYHVAIVAFAIFLLRSDEIKFDIKDYFNTLKMLALFAFAAIYVNSILNDGSGKINFMYVVKAPQEGLPFLNTNHGWLVYFCHYAFTAVFCLSLCYIKPIINGIKSLKLKK